MKAHAIHLLLPLLFCTTASAEVRFPGPARGRNPRTVALEQFVYSHPKAPKMFGFLPAGANWMEQKAIKAGKRLGRAIGAQKRAKTALKPLVCSKTGILYGDHIFRNAFFAGRQKNAQGSVKRWYKKQPWLKWDVAAQSYSYQKEGATAHILSTLGNAVSLHRGTSALEASYWKGVKKFYGGEMPHHERQQLVKVLSAAQQSWKLKPKSKQKLNSLISEIRSAVVPQKADRRAKTLFLLDLIAQRVEANDGYGAISTTPNLAVAKGWARGTQLGKIWGREQQPSTVISFDLKLSRTPNKVRDGLYAGMEDGAFIKKPVYVEVAFVTAEAKLHALKHLRVEP